ncbi:hypothetical protein GCM10007242_50250 [Pigmentiphaga litoralis]|nr:hypothetical protein [Pigmentiphaga litoralis]GGX36679.1 hypothetical protein GCM10007242_50250 [Pigmentiphaga litoralis]
MSPTQRFSRPYNDVALSRQVTLAQWHKRPVKDRVMEFISRFGERWL